MKPTTSYLKIYLLILHLIYSEINRANLLSLFFLFRFSLGKNELIIKKYLLSLNILILLFK